MFSTRSVGDGSVDNRYLGLRAALGESTTDPSDECEEFESTFSDDDEFPIGPDSADDQELSPGEENNEVNKEVSENVSGHNLRRLRRAAKQASPQTLASFSPQSTWYAELYLPGVVALLVRDGCNEGCS